MRAMRLDQGGEGRARVRTVKWMINEYRHEDKEGQYYLNGIIHIWLSGARCGVLVGLLPLIVWWILR